MKGWKTSAAVVILIILAVVTSSTRDAGWWPGLFLVAALAVVVCRAAYDIGYKDGQRDLVDLRPLTDDQRNELLMQATLSPKRPLAEMPPAELDRALVEAASRIAATVDVSRVGNALGITVA